MLVSGSVVVDIVQQGRPTRYRGGVPAAQAVASGFMESEIEVWQVACDRCPCFAPTLSSETRDVYRFQEISNRTH